MAADLEDRSRLALNQSFIDRVTGAVLVQANTVGMEASGNNKERAEKRTMLIALVLANPEFLGLQFARAAAGSTLANTFADTVGANDDIKVVGITDAGITTYVAAAWDVIAGVQPWERGA